MKKVFVPMLLVSLVGCSPIPFKVNAEKPSLKSLLTSYNENGYSKETVFYLTDVERGITDDFHAGANTKARRTYYNSGETALLMGDYEGGFSTINSGYKNIENGVQHFSFNGVLGTDDIFTAIEEGWTAENQSVGDYYPTLSSLSSLINEKEWEYLDGSFVYNIENLEVVDGVYNDENLQKFQYFAAPMLLQTDRYAWKSIRIKEESSCLVIELISDATKDAAKTIEHDEKDALISKARIYKGIHYELRNPSSN